MSKVLPPDASVEHLKKQAKALLKSCRAGDPAAHHRLAANHPRYSARSNDPRTVTLQETQLVIAREHGHASWPSLSRFLCSDRKEDSADESGILLYTNGRSAIDVLTEANIPGEKLEWLEALHDGPVPRTATREELYRIRARHFADLGWTSEEGALQGFEKRDEPLSRWNEYKRLELWFEHDLFDQLQLIQLVDRIAEIPEWKGRTVLYQFDTFLGHLKPNQLMERRPGPVTLADAHFQVAQRAWEAFCSGSPEKLGALAADESSPLPFLGAALLRLCEEFPSPENGLGRTESEILAAVAAGAESPVDLFRYCQNREEAAFMGDSSFYALVERLFSGPAPQLRTGTGEPFRTPADVGYTETFRAQRLQITDTGKQVLQGERDWLALLPVPYWIGGFQIAGPASPRWDRKAAVFT